MKFLGQLLCLVAGHAREEPRWGHRRLSYLEVCPRCGTALVSYVGRDEVHRRLGDQGWDTPGFEASWREGS